MVYEVTVFTPVACGTFTVVLRQGGYYTLAIMETRAVRTWVKVAAVDTRPTYNITNSERQNRYC